MPNRKPNTKPNPNPNYKLKLIYRKVGKKD